MKKQGIRFIHAVSVLFLFSGLAVADNASQQIQMLNSQIQSQLQQMQDAQQKQIKTLNAQLQSQLKETQATLQKQIQDVNTSTQSQLKTMQATFQAQLQQLQTDKAKPASPQAVPMSTTTPAASSPASKTAPAPAALPKKG